MSETKKARHQLDMSLEMIQGQLEKLSSIAKSSLPLDPEYMTALLNITKTLVMVDKNEKENPEGEDDLAGLTEAELIAMAREEILKHDGTKATPIKVQGKFRETK